MDKNNMEQTVTAYTTQTDAKGAVDTAANCRNCGTVAQGRFCPACGQETHLTVPTLAEYLGDYINGLFNLDGRIWRTLRLLLFHPGALTKAYVDGKRASYIPPLKLYLAMSVIAFLVAALPGVENKTAETLTASAASVDDPATTAPVAGSNRSGLTITNAQGKVISITEATAEDCDMDMGYFEHFQQLRESVRKACNSARLDGGAAVSAAFMDNLPLLAFLVIPVMAALFKLFYLFPGRLYIEHLTLLMHNHAFIFALMVVQDVMARLSHPLPLVAGVIQFVSVMALLFWLPVYFFLSIRRVYAQGLLLTVVKFPVMVIVYAFISMWIFILGLLVTMITV